MGHMVRCPKCGHRFDEGYGGAALRYSLGTVEFLGKGSVHVGARLIGGTLGAFFGETGSKYGSRAGGMAAKSLVGDLGELETSKIKCPRCGNKW